jgi:hypothetical protein
MQELGANTSGRAIAPRHGNLAELLRLLLAIPTCLQHPDYDLRSSKADVDTMRRGESNEFVDGFFVASDITKKANRRVRSVLKEGRHQKHRQLSICSEY